MSDRLERCAAFARSSRFHLLMMLVWVALIVPTLIWWADSILWVLLISIYANFVGHFGAYQAARSEEAQQ